MSQATIEPANGKDTRKAVDPSEKAMTFVPLGGGEPVELSLALARRYIAKPTRGGNLPSDIDLIKFLKLCEANKLNPWVGDANLVGYDEWRGDKCTSTFSMIVAAQALFKRAELNPHFEGIESGVVVLTTNDEVIYREGDLVLGKEVLLGGWARVYRGDRKKVFYDALDLKVYSTGKSRWSKDPAGMIVKCAESSALRKALPNIGGGLYTLEEMEHVIEAESVQVQPSSQGAMADAMTQLAGTLPAIEAKPAAEKFVVTKDSAEPVTVAAAPKEAPATGASAAKQTVEKLKKQIEQLPEPEAITAAGPEPSVNYREQIANATSKESLADLIWDIDADVSLDEDKRKFLIRMARQAETKFDE